MRRKVLFGAFYSLYSDTVQAYFDRTVSPEWSEQIQEAISLLQQESDLQEIVRLVGVDALGEKERLTLECARSIREDFLHQIAFHEVDTYTSPKKQYGMLYLILAWYHEGEKALDNGVSFADIMSMPALAEIGRMKYVKESDWELQFKKIQNDLQVEYRERIAGGNNDAERI